MYPKKPTLYSKVTIKLNEENKSGKLETSQEQIFD